MASDLYQSVLKDKDHLDKTNPRFRGSTGGFSSSDFEYKNFLSAVKPRSKSNSFSSQNENKHQPPRSSSFGAASFVDSALKAQKAKNTTPNGIKNTEITNTKEKEKSKLYNELSSSPTRKAIDPAFIVNTNTSQGTHSEVEVDSCGSVNKLRSMFDKPLEKTLDTSKVSNKTHSNGFDVGALVASDSEASTNQPVDVIITINTKKLRKRQSSSEFENFEDRIVPTGKVKIDVNSMLAPDDTEIKQDKKDNIPDASQSVEENNIDFRKELEVERLKRTHEEVTIEKRFNIKRRSLKDKLKDMLSFDDSSEPVNTAQETIPEQPNEPEIKIKEPDNKIKEPEIKISKTGGEELNNAPPHTEIVQQNNKSNYKSAVERFDEFLNEHDDIELTHNEKSTIKLEDSEALISSSDTDAVILNDSELNADSSLMDSILNHIEESKTSDEADENYTTLFRPSSQQSDKTDEMNSDSEDQPPKLLPRLSKMNSNVVAEETVTVEEESEVEEMPDDITDDIQDGYSSQSTTCQTDSEGDESSIDDNENAHDLEEDYEETLPKSCIIKTKSKMNRRIIFNDKKIADVILTYGPSEYDRANADIDPIASSAEWELEKRVDNMDVYSVDLQKDERGLGLSIIGLGVGTETGVEKLGIFVKTLTENGASQKDGRIQVNDQILEVNGVSLVGVTQYFAAQTLKNTNGIVRFLMGREKSRRSHFAPGSAMAENPDMQKHIQEMKLTLEQMEELEDRALVAEKTLEDVKKELLDAEERAHESEHQLKETKEQLKVVTESPFVNGQRKMKNEMKKKGGKKEEKIDDLQKSLKDITKRLSYSEENLLELTSKTDTKEKQITDLQFQLEESEKQQQTSQLANQALQEDMKIKINEVNLLIQQNEKLQKELQEALEQFQKDRDIWNQKDQEIKLKHDSETESYNNQLNDLKEANSTLENKLHEIQLQVETDQKLSLKITALNKELAEHENLKLQLKNNEDIIFDNQKKMKDQYDEIEKLKAKKEYLQLLITKFDDSESETIQQLKDMFQEKEDNFMKEKEKLQQIISGLEHQLENPTDTFIQTNNDTSVTLDLDTGNLFNRPPLPQRKSVDAITLIPEPLAPAVERDRKPPVHIEKVSASLTEEVLIAPTFSNTVESNPYNNIEVESPVTTHSTNLSKELPKELSILATSQDQVIPQFDISEKKSTKKFELDFDSNSVEDSSLDSVETLPDLNFDISIPKVNNTLDESFTNDINPLSSSEQKDESFTPVALADFESSNDILTSSIDTEVSINSEEEPFLVVDTPQKPAKPIAIVGPSRINVLPEVSQNISLDSREPELVSQLNVEAPQNISLDSRKPEIVSPFNIEAPQNISLEFREPELRSHFDIESTLGVKTISPAVNKSGDSGIQLDLSPTAEDFSPNIEEHTPNIEEHTPNILDNTPNIETEQDTTSFSGANVDIIAPGVNQIKGEINTSVGPGVEEIKTPDIDQINIETQNKKDIQTSAALEANSDTKTISPVIEAKEDFVPMEGELKKYIEESKDENSNEISSSLSIPTSPASISTSPASISFEQEESIDEGQFEMIVEDLQDETNTPLNITKRKIDGANLVGTTNLNRLSSSGSEIDGKPSYELDDSVRKESFSDWLGQDLKRMGTLEKDMQAELIAEQVLSKSPVKKHAASISSSSDEEEDDVKILSEEENLDRKQSIKIDSSYFEKSNLEESFDAHGVSILDDELEYAQNHAAVSLKRSLSFDSVIPKTDILDNRILQARRAIVKFENKRKPTRGIHGSIADGLDDDFQITNDFSQTASKVEYKSTPNLLASSSSISEHNRTNVNLPRSNSLSHSLNNNNKPEKKHHFRFHLPKVFKKSKPGKKSSPSSPTSSDKSNKSPKFPTTSNTSINKSSTLPVVSTTVPSVSTTYPNVDDSPTIGMVSPYMGDSEVVPIHMKEEAIDQANANDAATEEAVVPFADKERLMSTNNNEDYSNDSPMISVHVNGDIKARLDTSSSEGTVPSPNISESSHTYDVGRLGSDASRSSVFNERGVDVGNFEESNTDTNNKNMATPPSQWNTSQVGLWLAERNLTQYVNNFKSNNVDGQTLLRADGNKLKEYGVTNAEDRNELKKRIKELRSQVGKDIMGKNKNKDKTNKYQFWKGKYKVVH